MNSSDIQGYAKLPEVMQRAFDTQVREVTKKLSLLHEDIAKVAASKLEKEALENAEKAMARTSNISVLVLLYFFSNNYKLVSICEDRIIKGAPYKMYDRIREGVKDVKKNIDFDKFSDDKLKEALIKQERIIAAKSEDAFNLYKGAFANSYIKAKLSMSALASSLFATVAIFGLNVIRYPSPKKYRLILSSSIVLLTIAFVYLKRRYDLNKIKVMLDKSLEESKRQVTRKVDGDCLDAAKGK